MSKCIIYRLEKVVGNFLSQNFILSKGLIKYNKINGITPTKTHVDFAHPKLFVQRKSQLVEKAMVGNDAVHVW